MVKHYRKSEYSQYIIRLEGLTKLVASEKLTSDS